ncbi:Homer protein 1 [Willisornis vidua]|uniref:Homer protein 1 n=7 Tax=Passeriformes TaxID=9126 RepID=A0ABQ9D6G3_9PASS|nr:Homer protein 1 [Willisornis vidua]
MPFLSRTPELDTALQVGSHHSRVEGQNLLSHSTGHTAFHAAQETTDFLCCECALLDHVQPLIHKNPQVLLSRAALHLFIHQPALVPKAAPAQVHHRALCVVKSHEIPMDPLLVLVQVPLYGIPSFREQPIFSTRAHVFQIDPNTKKNWVPTSKHAVTVSYFYDSTRNVYRIISLDGSKAIINSTITPNMTFTKTSQKFGQWADSRANTVYGLGFSSEHHLSKFAEKFQEFKEAARIAKEKSHEKMELTSTPSQESAGGDIQSPLTPESINGTDDERAMPEVTQNSEPRAEPTQNALPFTHSSTISKHWEAELATLKGNNAKLTAALLESTANVKQWKQQLAAYQEEAERLHKRVTELECVSSQANAVHTHKTELNQTIQELEATLKKKEEEIEGLKQEIENARELQAQRDSLTQKLQEVEIRNKDLEGQLSDLEQRLEKSQNEQEAFRNNLKTLLEILDGKIFELTELRDNLAKLIECS